MSKQGGRHPFTGLSAAGTLPSSVQGRIHRVSRKGASPTLSPIW
jgi:hypothetical protein